MDPGLTIVLLGHSGVGKSVSGNTILGRPAFESRKALIPVATQICEQTGSVFGKNISVIDTPGILCAGAEEQVRTRCQEVLRSSRPKLFLVLIRVRRFTAQHQKAMEAAVRALGDEGLKHSYLLFTGGDGLGDMTLEDYIFEFKASPLVQFAEKFGRRFHLFNNKTNEEEQVRQLLDKVPEINLPGLTIVLLGRSGVGKSATGNTILGRPAFVSRKALIPVTRQICEQTGSVFGKLVSVIDTPGILCAGAEEQVRTRCQEVLQSSRPRLFLVLIRVGRFTEEDQEAVEAAVRALGDEGLKHSYLLFTGGDGLKDKTLEDYFFEFKANPLIQIVEMFGRRFHLFNNKTNEEEQVRQLLEKSQEVQKVPEINLPAERISAGLERPHCGLETLRMDHGGPQRLKPDVRKYACELELDPNTMFRFLKLSDNNRKVTGVMEDQSYPDHPDRFDSYPQLLSRNVLTGRCYWEVEWRGEVFISVSYRSINRKGDSEDRLFGGNDQSWSLRCSDDDGYSVWHNNIETSISSSSISSSSSSSSSSVSNRVAVYVDCPAGTLSFYRVSSDTLIHLHTFNTTFTGPLYAGFGFWSDGSSVSLVPL